MLSIHLELGRGSKLRPTDCRYGVKRSGQVVMVWTTRHWTPGTEREPVRERSSWRMAELLVLPVEQEREVYTQDRQREKIEER